MRVQSWEVATLKSVTSRRPKSLTISTAVLEAIPAKCC
nr:MAG TPA: hypothetical protein [Caudoviricetes sp.]